MNLWLSSQFLVAGLFLSSSALTPEECQPLITPLSLADPSMVFWRKVRHADQTVQASRGPSKELLTLLTQAPYKKMFGRSNFIMGYTDNEFYNNFLKNIESYWININPSPSSPNTIVLSTENKINGSCLSISTNLNFDGNTISTSFSNFSSAFHMFPTCDGCLLYSFNRTARNLDKMYSKMNINGDVTAEEISYRAFYLMARETTVKDSDLEHFKKQASCLGFNREPDFIYNPENDFCAEGEGRRIPEYYE